MSDDILGSREEQLERLIRQERAENQQRLNKIIENLANAMKDDLNRQFYIRQALEEAQK